MVKRLLNVLMRGEVLSVDTSRKAACVVFPWRCNWLNIDGESGTVKVQNRVTSQDEVSYSKRAVAFVKRVALDNTSLQVMPLRWLECLKVQFLTE